MKEPTIRILVGRDTPEGPVTAIVPLDTLPNLTARGWIFVCADPDDLSEYLSWLYQRETEAND